MTSAILLSAVAASGISEARAREERNGHRGILSAVFKHLDPLKVAIIMPLFVRSPWLKDTTIPITTGLWVIHAMSRCLPAPPWSVGGTSFLLQRCFAVAGSLIEAPVYMMSFAVAFACALPSLILSKFSQFAWSRLQQQGQPLPHEGEGWSFEGPRQQLSRVSAYWGSGGAACIDVECDYSCETVQEPKRDAVIAETPLGKTPWEKL